MNTVYIEKEVVDHPRTVEILTKFQNPRIIYIDRYPEVFNRNKQNFRKQKEFGQHFILARKRQNFVLPNPKYCPSQTVENYYFSHLYNCPFDCEYCFLQGMYRSAYFVIFVNYEDFQIELQKTITSLDSEQSLTFFSGYDCDSLALETITGFARKFIPWFQKFPQAILELRTKSANIQVFKELTPSSNINVAWTLSPKFVQENWEARTASLAQRFDAIKCLVRQGWVVGLRLDPLIWFPNWRQVYTDFFTQIKAELPVSQIANVYLGLFRLPGDVFKKITKIRPQSKLFAREFFRRPEGELSYFPHQEEELISFVDQECLNLWPAKKIVSCYSGFAK